MFIARWSVEVRFGRKEAALALMRRWWEEIAPAIGWSRQQARLLSGSLGVPESRVEVEIALDDLAELEQAWARLAALEAQSEWARELEGLIVSGSTNWTLYRLA